MEGPTQPCGDDEEQEDSTTTHVEVPSDPEVWGEFLRTASIGSNQGKEGGGGDSSSSGVELDGTNKFELRNQEKYVVGRDPEQAHIRINDLHVSSKHCTIFRDEHQIVWIEDSSLSGTWVNGQKVAKGTRKRLVNGDTITLLRPSSTSTQLPPTPTTTKKKPAPPSNFYEFVFRDRIKLQGPCRGDINLKYEILEEIGSGSFATVRKAMNKTTHVPVAIKIIERKQFQFEPEKWKDQMKEIDMLKRLSHDSCVELLDVFQVDDALYICMEFITGGELFDRILKRGKIPEENSRVLVRRLVDAVAYLHLQGIVHRDLKPENILIRHSSDNCLHIKVADFGVARIATGGCKTITGSLAYIAPEVLDRQDTVQGLGTYSYEVDMWSVGVIVYVCLLGRLPFQNVQESTQLKQAVPKMFSSNELDSISENGKDFLSGLFAFQNRFTASKALEHVWLKDSAHCAKDETCGFAPGEDVCSICAATHGTTTTTNSNHQKKVARAPPVPLFSQ